ncbi:MAG TPA: hypothetical protein QGF58_29490 [Myxococcota bacterium]|nr:hypothetical protein [Myxococcota bacterium]
MAKHELVPSEVLRVLSTHGELNAVLGGVGIRCHVAPFEETIFLFVRPGHQAEIALLGDNRAEIRAADAERTYSVHLKGRAVAGRPGHRWGRSSELTPWVPEGSKLPLWHVIPFWAEEVEYTRGHERFHGKTEAAKVPSRPSRWAWAAWSGAAWALILGELSVWAYLIFKGPELMFRPVAFVLAAAAVAFGVGGAQAFYRAQAFHVWRKNSRHEGAGMLADGLLAPSRVSLAGLVYTCIMVLLLVGLSPWGGDVVGVTFVATFTWLLWPLNMTRVFTVESAEEGRG